jgi:hypothetical protein
MAILTHAKENEVQDWLSAPRQWDHSGDFFRGLARGFRRRKFSWNPMDLISGNVQRLEEAFPGHSKIAFQMLRWHAPLICPEEMNDRETNVFCLFGDGIEESPGDPAAGQSDMPSGPGRRSDLAQPILSRRLR